MVCMNAPRPGGKRGMGPRVSLLSAAYGLLDKDDAHIHDIRLC
jgi:hypothetical protein